MPSHDSNLNEVNMSIQAFVYSILNTWTPDLFENLKQIILVPSGDREDDIRNYERRGYKKDPKKSVHLPFAAISRKKFSGFLNSNATAPRRKLTGMQLTGVTHDTNSPGVVDVYEVTWANIDYQIRLYLPSFKIAEYLTQQLVFSIGRGYRYDFESKILKPTKNKPDSPDSKYRQDVSISVQSAPEYIEIPGRGAKEDGAGSIYVMELNITAYTTLALKKDSAIIKQIFYNTFTGRQEDLDENDYDWET